MIHGVGEKKRETLGEENGVLLVVVNIQIVTFGLLKGLDGKVSSLIWRQIQRARSINWDDVFWKPRKAWLCIKPFMKGNREYAEQYPVELIHLIMDFMD